MVDSYKYLSNITDWTAYADGFGVGATSLTEQGTNADSPWTFHPYIDSQASWIWTGEGNDFGTRYFSASITSTSPVPEPATVLLMLPTGNLRLRESFLTKSTH